MMTYALDALMLLKINTIINYLLTLFLHELGTYVAVLD
jgi:hypothetical protein